MSLAVLKGRFDNWRQWELNPIVIKELRQAVRSWTVTGVLLLFLTLLFFTSLFFLVAHLYVSGRDAGLGASMFSAFLMMLAAASVCFVPLHVGIRMGMERQQGNPDLLYASTLTPGSIIRGKFICGAYMALLFFSACMPFMAFTNLLRGVDLPTVFGILGFLFAVVCMANMVAIFMACLPASRPFKFLLAMYGMGQMLFLIGPLVYMSQELLRSGLGSMMFGRGFWAWLSTSLTMSLAFTGLLYFLSVALISPLSANRALPLRVYITVAWIVTGLLGLGWVLGSGNPDRILPWTWVSVAVMIVALLATVSNSDQLSLRVQRAIPPGGFRRVLAFVFFNGAAGGLVWASVILWGTYLVMAAQIIPHKGTFLIERNTVLLPTLIAYAFDYALLALFIQRRFLSRLPSKTTGLLTILLAGAWALLPTIILFFLNKLSWTTISSVQLGNPFSVLGPIDTVQQLHHLFFSLAWLVVMTLLNAKWFVRQIANFRPPPPAPPILP
jgi:hypothetical protein